MLVVENPTHLPPVTEIAYMEEPVINAQIFTPPEFVGPIMELCQYKRGVYKDLVYLDKSRVSLKYTHERLRVARLRNSGLRKERTRKTRYAA